MNGANAAARALRAAGAKGLKPATTGPKGSFFPWALMYFSAVRIIHSEFFSHSVLESPQAVIPWPQRMHPMVSGFFSLIAAMSSPS